MPFAGPPKILGHENAGYLEDTGPDVTGVGRGDPVRGVLRLHAAPPPPSTSSTRDWKSAACAPFPS